MTLAHKILNRHIHEHPFQGLEDEQCKIALRAMEDYAQERAQVLVDALESIANGATPLNSMQEQSWINTARTIAREALSSYNKKQEDGE